MKLLAPIAFFLLLILSTAALSQEHKMDNIPIAEGIFKPDWQQVADNYKKPEWFNQAKFGVWIHWGAQAMGESGDWFAKFMYYPFGDPTNNDAYKNHLAKWGHPSVTGYKDILPQWKAEKWDPEKIMKLYKEAGAKYVMILGTHHDNFDNWDSKYQPWNSVNIGPKKDIVGGWVKAAKEEDMRYGISFHADYSWWWWQAAFVADTSGPYKGVPYDAAQPYNTDTCWWKGYDLKDLYGKNILNELPAGKDPRDDFFSYVPETLQDTAYGNWYCTKWCNRVEDLVAKYQPDILYFDGSTYPFSGTGTGRGYKSDATIRMAANFYNSNMKKNNGKLEALLFTKGYEVANAISSTHESNVPDKITDTNAWMSENSVGEWFYKPGTYYSTRMVVHQMVEAFSHGGNYMINIPINAAGVMDDDGIKTLKEIGVWMKTNGEAVYGSTDWKVIGEGDTKMRDGNLRKEQDVNFTPQDIRFTTNNGAVYAFVMGAPLGKQILIKSITPATLKTIKSVTILGSTEKLKWKQTPQGLVVSYSNYMPGELPFVLRVK